MVPVRRKRAGAAWRAGQLQCKDRMGLGAALLKSRTTQNSGHISLAWLPGLSSSQSGNMKLYSEAV